MKTPPETDGARKLPWWHWRSELGQTLLMLVLLGTFRASFANHYRVPSGSMEPTLQVGDHVLVDMRAHGWRVPMTTVHLTDGVPVQRGEVVVFDSPKDGTRLIKRVVAVGGDEASVRDGRVFIDNTSLRATPGDMERFGERLAVLDLADGGGPDIGPIRVPRGMLLMLGDHRGNSFDGRFFGFVEERKVYGRAAAVIWRSGDGLTWKRL